MQDLRAPKHLVLNGFPLQDSHRGRGVGRYTMEVYDAILRRWEENDEQLHQAFSAITVLGGATPDFREIFQNKYPQTNYVAITPKVEKRNLLKYFYYKFSAVPKADAFFAQIKEPTVYFLPRHQILTSKNASYTVTMVHDFAPLKTQRFGKNPIIDPLLRIEYQQYMKELKKSDLIVTNSSDTTNAVGQYVGRKEDIATILLGNVFEHVSPKPHLLRPAPMREPYFLYFAGYDYNKNIPGIIKAFATFIRKHEDTNHTKLVFSGGIKDEKRIITLAKQEGILENIVLMPIILDEDLPWYAVHSLGLFRLSYIEGCGLPEIEIMSLGVPVISANIGAVQEMVGAYALLADPHKPETAEPLLYQAAKKRIPKEHLEKAAAHARTFTWGKTAQETIDAIMDYTQSHKPKNMEK
ncbi:MAG: glycosyltransferase [Patescibacteria group bacterium]